MAIRFFDFTREIAAIGEEMRSALDRVLGSGRYILGDEVATFEDAYADLCACSFAVGVASGTDALFLALKAYGIGEGDEVITVAHTFMASALAIAYTGATPVFVDIGDTSHLIDPACLEAAVTEKTKAVIPVHLYGQCADMDRIMDIARSRGLVVVEDACQAHGARYKGRPAGSLGHAAAFSFYPTKNLGAYGDGGMITTNDAELCKRLRLLRNYGQTDRYHHVIRGYNSRLDEMQAAILKAKLPYLEQWIMRRQEIARQYGEGLRKIELIRPCLAEGSTNVYYLYVIAVEDRDALQTCLEEKGIETLIHYPVPLHRQKAFGNARVSGVLKNTENRVGQILSLPMYPWLRDDEVSYIIEAIKGYYL